MSLQRRSKRCCVVNERQVTIRRKTRQNRINNKCIKVRVLRARLERTKEEGGRRGGEGATKGRQKGWRAYAEKVRDPIIQPNGKDTLFSGRAVPFLHVLPMSRLILFRPVTKKKESLKCVSFPGFANCVKCQSVQAGKRRNQSHQV